jgi:hypothetical protein
MTLTIGSGPFGHRPAGRFNVEIPVRDVLFVDPSPRWIRAARDGETVLDSRRAKMLHQHGRLARYFVPRDDVRWDRLGDVQPVEPPAPRTWTATSRSRGTTSMPGSRRTSNWSRTRSTPTTASMSAAPRGMSSFRPTG